MEPILNNFLAKLALAPNNQAACDLFSSFQKEYNGNFDFTINQEFISCYSVAKARVRRMEAVPQELQLLMVRLQDCFYNALQHHFPVLSNLKQLLGDAPLDISRIDDYMSAINPLRDKVTFSDIRSLFGSGWSRDNSHDEANFEPMHTIKVFYRFIYAAGELQAAVQAQAWEESGLLTRSGTLLGLLKKLREGTLPTLTEDNLRQLASTQETLYIPIGYANYRISFLHLLAIDFCPDDGGYRLRLLASDNGLILAAQDKKDHFCPEVVWKGLTLEAISAPCIWKQLFEVPALEKEDLTYGQKFSTSTKMAAYDALHLVTWLTRRLGKRPEGVDIQLDEDQWSSVLSGDAVSYTVSKNLNTFSSPVDEGDKSILLRPTEKSVKNSLTFLTLHKYVNLLPMDLLKKKNQMLLFKAESRLLLLVGAYLTLRDSNIPNFTRGDFLTLVKNSFGKVAAPIERVMMENPTGEEQQVAKKLLASLVDLKYRLDVLVNGSDRSTLAPPKPLYRSTHTPHLVNLSCVERQPVEHSLIDIFRFSDETATLPSYREWTASCFEEIYATLEKCYDQLLDAKLKCEPIEIVVMAHRNVFSKLPIPSTDRVEDTFPDAISEGLLVGTLLLLKKISSLVASEAYSDELIPPLFVADMTRVYRFGCELYRKINPAVQKLPISWFCLDQYMQSRHSFHTYSDVRTTLEALVSSFRAISPNGHLRTSDRHQEIPLFYYSWSDFPLSYTLHRKSLGPFRGNSIYSVEEVLARAELAGSIGLTPADIEYNEEKDAATWANSFGGQSALAVEEIAEYYTMSILASTKSHQALVRKKKYRDHELREYLGPDDYLQITPVSQDRGFTALTSKFGNNKFQDMIAAGETPMSQRMVVIHEREIRRPIADISHPYVTNWRQQAELIKLLPKANVLHQVASGPSTLSLDLLLEFFESRPSLLLSVDYRSYFWAILRSQHVLEDACEKEPLVLDRFHKFLSSLYREDSKNFRESNLHFERMLWISSVTRHLLQLESAYKEPFTHIIECIVSELRGFAKGEKEEARLAPHLIACQKWLKTFKLQSTELARLHLIVGRQPPIDPNEALLKLEVCEAMQQEAPRIQEALLHQDEETRHAIWSLILDSEEDVQEAMQRKVEQGSSSCLLKSQMQALRLAKKGFHLDERIAFYKKRGWRMPPWRKEATERVAGPILANAFTLQNEFAPELARVYQQAEKQVYATATSVFLILADRVTTVDWETGRLVGAGERLPVPKVLPVYLKKLPKLAPLGATLSRPLVRFPNSLVVQFEGVSHLFLDVSTGDAWIMCNNDKFSLVSNIDFLKMGLPSQFSDGFSVWLNDKNEGVITAQEIEGIPHPVFLIDSDGAIRPMTGNRALRLAKEGYYPAAQLFCRWGLVASDILVWLDAQNNVAELHLPLHNGRSKYTRVIRTDDNGWMIDGLEVRLEATSEAVLAFGGHHVYLTARNSKGQRLLLLPGATPYVLRDRRVKNKHLIDWNKILTVGDDEGIHQFRILASGKIEGLTVADNLLLMLWMVYMGEYRTASDLALRWLTPPGRAYSKEEQRILLTWVKGQGHRESLMENEMHPSAIAIRLYVIGRILRHIKEYPLEQKEGGKVAELATFLVGSKAFNTGEMIWHQPATRGCFGRQIRGTKLEELLSVYDHESVCKFVTQKYDLSPTSLDSRLYKRLNSSLNEAVTWRIFPNVHGEKMYNLAHRESFIALGNVISCYPTTPQVDAVPVDKLYKSFIDSDVTYYFDRAYRLIKDGPQNPDETKEYEALLHALTQLRGEKMIDLGLNCLHFDHLCTIERLELEVLLLWLLLEQAFIAKKANTPLPDLPSRQGRFGLVLEESKKVTRAFFEQLAVDAKELVQSYLSAWFEKRGMRYFEQKTFTFAVPQSFNESLKRPISDLLVEEIKRWSSISSPLERKDNRANVQLSGWSFTMAEEWVQVEPTKRGLLLLKPQLIQKIKELQAERAKREKQLLEIANALPDDINEKIKMVACQMHFDPPLSVDECIGRILMGQGDRFQKELLLYLEVALDTAHLERALSDLNSAQDSDEMQKMLEQLLTPHSYTPGTQSFLLMVAEYYADCRLRTQPDQAKLIEILSHESSDSVGMVIQAIMGSGKSKMLAPIWLQKMLEKGRIPILCVPNSLFRTTLSDLQTMMWTRFRTHVRALNFTRESCSSQVLYLLAEKLHIARQEPTVFVCTPRDLHALQLMLKERHQLIEDMRDRLARFTMNWLHSQGLDTHAQLVAEGDWDKLKGSKECSRWYLAHEKLEKELKPLFEEANLLQAILNLLQNQSALLVDEVAECYDPRNLLSFPIGWQIPANPRAAMMGCKVYFEWLPQFYDKIDLLNNMQGLSQSITRGKIYLGIAKLAWDEYQELIPDFPPFRKFKYYLFFEL